MANSGCHNDARDTEALFARNFAGYDYVVAPSGSCAHHVRDQLTAIEQTPQVREGATAPRCELVEFLHDVLEGARRSRGPSSRTRWGCTTAAPRCAACARPRPRRSTSRRSTSRRAAVRGEGHRARDAAAARRVLRLRRHVFGVRGAGVGQDGLRQGQRPQPGRRRVHRHRRHVVPDAPAGLRRAHRPAAEVHPHRPGAQRSGA